MVIHMDEDKMREICIGIRSVCREMEMCMSSIERILQDVGQGWQGEAEKAFERKITATRRQYKKIISLFQAYGDELEVIVNEYQEWEEKNASRIQSV